MGSQQSWQQTWLRAPEHAGLEPGRALVWTCRRWDQGSRGSWRRRTCCLTQTSSLWLQLPSSEITLSWILLLLQCCSDVCRWSAVSSGEDKFKVGCCSVTLISSVSPAGLSATADLILGSLHCRALPPPAACTPGSHWRGPAVSQPIGSEDQTGTDSPDTTHCLLMLSNTSAYISVENIIF